MIINLLYITILEAFLNQLHFYYTCTAYWVLWFALKPDKFLVKVDKNLHNTDHFPFDMYCERYAFLSIRFEFCGEGMYPLQYMSKEKWSVQRVYKFLSTFTNTFLSKKHINVFNNFFDKNFRDNVSYTPWCFILYKIWNFYVKSGWIKYDAWKQLFTILSIKYILVSIKAIIKKKAAGINEKRG